MTTTEWFATYLSKLGSWDFLLNITAEALGVAAEIVIIVFLLQRYFDRRELRRWESEFRQRLSTLLKHHNKLPKFLAEYQYDDPYAVKLMFWAEEMDSKVRDCLAMTAPKPDNPLYQKAETYRDALDELNGSYARRIITKAELDALNKCAKDISESVSPNLVFGNIWSKAQIDTMQSELSFDSSYM